MLPIAPSWNWNIAKVVTIEYRLCLPIAPSWNWNFFAGGSCKLYGLLPIAPSWNWNQIEFVANHNAVFGSQSHQAGIETSVICVFAFSNMASQSHQAGIETHLNVKPKGFTVLLPIAPSWNWNVIIGLNVTPVKFSQSHQAGIETQCLLIPIRREQFSQSHQAGIETRRNFW